jgi:hypothetical protein
LISRLQRVQNWAIRVLFKLSPIWSYYVLLYWSALASNKSTH